MQSTDKSPAELALEYRQIIDETAKALECEPGNIKLMATAARCSNRLAAFDFGKLLELSETHCNKCSFFEDSGELRDHCDRCCRRITTEIYRRMHLGPRPDPDVEPAFLVARCRRCGAVGAAHVIEADPSYPIDLGQIVQKSLRDFLVRIETGPIAITGCQCDEA